MAESYIENSLETLNINGHQQPSVPDPSFVEDFDKILAGFPVHPETNRGLSILCDGDNTNDQFDIDALIDSTVGGSDITEILGGDDSFRDLFEDVPKPEPQEHEPPTLYQRSTFIEHYDSTTFYPPQSVQQQLSNVPVGSSPMEPQANGTVMYNSEFLYQQQEMHQAAKKAKKQKNHRQYQSTTVGPVEYVMHSGGCEPCTTVQMQYDYAYQQQILEYDAEESKKIQIQAQPRSQFRPRTQNESRISSHYLRCEEGIKPEYPTIAIPPGWNFHSDINVIEVALVGLDKQAHPYSLDNKNCSDTFEDNALIFKQHEPNVLYFRLTNEDFQNGYKTFMIELIKAKQDNVLTKEVIRTRQLEHSMLRFTRIFQEGKGLYQRDEGSTEYSSVMSEAYGDVNIEHMGPKYGPMTGQEMVYIVLKGRILKNDLKIEVKESLTGWEYSVENFTKNGNVIYFLMPAFPYSMQFETAKASIIVYYKGDELHESPYLYKGSLDQELEALRISNQATTATASVTSNTFDLFGFLSATNAHANPSSKKKSSAKTPKRLGDKLKK